jgi:hypothetical protein
MFAVQPRACCLVLALAAACDPLGGPGPLAEACEHLTALSSQLSAGNSAASAPAVATHTHYDLRLPAVDGGRAGVVKYTSVIRGQLLVLLSADLPVRLAPAMGSEIVPKDSGKSGPCPEIAAWYDYDIGVGAQLITVGGPGVNATAVGLVLESEP